MARSSAQADVVDATQRPHEELHDRLRDILARFEREVKGVLGSAIIDPSGVALAWTLKGGAHQLVVSTLGSALWQIIDRTGASLDLGNAARGIVSCEKGSLAVYEIPGSQGFIMVVLLDSNANHIDFMMRCRLVLDDLSQVVAGGG